jgi:preprotein translocase subunit YajC
MDVLSFSMGNIIFQLIVMLVPVVITIVIFFFLIKNLIIHSPKRRNKEILDKLDEISKKLDQRK